MDLVFCVCQLVEKVIEHNTKVFLLFVDLHKAYDSVLRQALWCALQRVCIPENLIALVLRECWLPSLCVGSSPHLFQ